MLELLSTSRKSLNQQCSKKTLIYTPRLQQIQNLIFWLLSFYGIIHVTTLSGNFQVYKPALMLSLKSSWIQSFHIPPKKKYIHCSIFQDILYPQISKASFCFVFCKLGDVYTRKEQRDTSHQQKFSHSYKWTKLIKLSNNSRYD